MPQPMTFEIDIVLKNIKIQGEFDRFKGEMV